MSTDLQPGVYRTTRDVPAIAPDKRVKHDWRALPIKAGTLFLAKEWRYRASEPPCLELVRYGAYGYMRVISNDPKAAALVASLERIGNPTVTQHLRFRDNETYQGALLNRICAEHGVSLADIDAMCAEIDAKIDADANAMDRADIEAEAVEDGK